MDLDLPMPDHTTLSRQSSSLKPVLNTRASLSGPVHLIVDSKGLSNHGGVPWSGYKQGKKRIRGWRKLHGAVDQNGNLLATSVSKGTTRDASGVPSLLREYSGPIDSFTGERGDDQTSIYDDVLGRNRSASIVIHPRGIGVHSDRKQAL